MDKATRTNPETWGLTEQEMKFADAYVYIHFHSTAIAHDSGTNAMKIAGYEVPTDVHQAQNIANTLKAKCQKYIDAEVERFREILSTGQCKALWKYISDFEPGTPDDSFSGGSAAIISH